jgi:hypothetical protein
VSCGTSQTFRPRLSVATTRDLMRQPYAKMRLVLFRNMLSEAEKVSIAAQGRARATRNRHVEGVLLVVQYPRQHQQLEACFNALKLFSNIGLSSRGSSELHHELRDTIDHVTPINGFKLNTQNKLHSKNIISESCSLTRV